MADGTLTSASWLPALPWLLFVHHLAESEHARIRISPALIDLGHALAAALARYDRSHESVPMLTTWETAIRDVVRSTETPPRAPYATTWALLHSALEALRECHPAHRALVAPVVAALEELDGELASELYGHLRWSVSVHAVERWIERIEPTADAAEAVASIARLAARAVWLRRVRSADGEGDEYVSPDNVRVALVVSRDGVVMTVVKRAMEAKVLRAIRAAGRVR